MEDEEFLCPSCGGVLSEDVLESSVCDVEVDDGQLIQGKHRTTYDIRIKVFCPECSKEWMEEEFQEEFLRKE
jgi:ferredoxin-fold anticodon binding domain-containing protein